MKTRIQSSIRRLTRRFARPATAVATVAFAATLCGLLGCSDSGGDAVPPAPTATPAPPEALVVPGAWSRTEQREACASFDIYRQPWFGETHVHTAYSSDAVFAGTRENPRGAYVFAKGGDLPLPPFDAEGAPAPTSRFRGRDRPRRAIRRDPDLSHAGTLGLRLARVRFGAQPAGRAASGCADTAPPARGHPVPAHLRPAECQALVLVRPRRGTLPRPGLARLAGRPGRGGGALRPDRRVRLHDLRRLRVVGAAERQ